MIILIFFIVVVLTSLLLFYTTNNLILTGIYFAIFIINIFLVYYVKYKKYKVLKFNFKECLLFIEKYIIALNSRSSLTSACEYCYPYLRKSTIELINNNNINIHNSIEALSKIYSFQIFQVFKKIIYQYEVTGGDILESGSFLLTEATRLKCDEKYVKKSAISTVIGFATTWAMAFLVLGVARLSLSNFFASIENDYYYLILVFSGFLLFILSLNIYCLKIMNTNYVKGAKNEKD